MRTCLVLSLTLCGCANLIGIKHLDAVDAGATVDAPVATADVRPPPDAAPVPDAIVGVKHALIVNLVGGGSVTMPNGTKCSSSPCTASLDEGSMATISAGTGLQGWHGCTSTTSTSCGVVMNRDTSVWALFSDGVHGTILVDAEGAIGGSVTVYDGSTVLTSCPSPSVCPVQALDGHSLSLEVGSMPPSFVGWWEACASRHEATQCPLVANKNSAQIAVAEFLPGTCSADNYESAGVDDADALAIAGSPSAWQMVVGGNIDSSIWATSVGPVAGAIIEPANPGDEVTAMTAAGGNFLLALSSDQSTFCNGQTAVRGTGGMGRDIYLLQPSADFQSCTPVWRFGSLADDTVKALLFDPGSNAIFMTGAALPGTLFGGLPLLGSSMVPILYLVELDANTLDVVALWGEDDPGGSEGEALAIDPMTKELFVAGVVHDASSKKDNGIVFSRQGGNVTSSGSFPTITITTPGDDSRPLALATFDDGKGMKLAVGGVLGAAPVLLGGHTFAPLGGRDGFVAVYAVATGTYVDGLRLGGLGDDAVTGLTPYYGGVLYSGSAGAGAAAGGISIGGASLSIPNSTAQIAFVGGKFPTGGWWGAAPSTDGIGARANAILASPDNKLVGVALTVNGELYPCGTPMVTAEDDAFLLQLSMP